MKLIAAELHEEPGGGYGFSAAGVVLHPGENTLTAVAKDYAGNKSEQSVTVTYAMQASYNYSYDNNGNLETMVKTGQSTETTTYEYDYENRLTKVTLPGSTGTNLFQYDGDKRRVSATNTAGTVTKFLYDGVNNLKDYAADGTVLASYVQGIGIDKLISRTDANGKRYYHADALGSTRMMTRPDQTSAATYTYDAWGKVTSPPNQNDGNRHKFTAREFEDEIGLQYNRARFYDPETGRFITQDPLTKGPDDPTVTYFSGIYSTIHRFVKDYVDGLQPHKTNRYVYCYNNPTNLIDPLGLDPQQDVTDDFKTKAQQEQVGQKKSETAGRQQTPAQPSQNSQDVRERHAIRQQTTQPAIEREGVEKLSEHREQLLVKESGEKILIISEGGRSQAINLGKEPEYQ